MPKSVFKLGLMAVVLSLSLGLTACLPPEKPSGDKKGDTEKETPTSTDTSGGNTKVGANSNLTLGNPSNAKPDTSSPANFLSERKQFAMSYNRDKGIPNWVSWHLDKNDLGDVERSQFKADPELPAGWYKVTPQDYTNSGYDRGHMCPSADRDKTEKDNEAVFVMTNIIPQAGGNNQGPWANLEKYSRRLVEDGNELYIICGGSGEKEKIAKGKVSVPKKTWKVIVVLKNGSDDLKRINENTRVIAISMPNEEDVRTQDWQEFRTTVAAIEKDTGYKLLSNLPANVQKALKSKVDKE